MILIAPLYNSVDTPQSIFWLVLDILMFPIF